MQREKIENCQSPFVFQIINAGSRHDNEYEVKMLLSEVVDLSTLKITVKSNNLRVGVCCNGGAVQMKEMDNLVYQRAIKNDKHSENFLIPEDFDGDRVRANYDIKNRTLIIHAPRRDYYVKK